jgi:mono/diheme cytochrome c family protein
LTAIVVIAVVAVLVVGWLAFLVASSIRNRGREEVPRNVAPGKTDDELESRRLEKVQAAAVVLTGFLAFYLPIYYLGEQDRQAGFVEQFDEESLERGAEVVASVGCTDCHGSDWSGGGANYVERRSGITVTWAAPSLNDVFYRYNDEEVRYWIVYGRANSPMPAWGTEGGGPLDQQQVSDVINYLATQQIDQQAALAKIDPSVDLQLQRLNQADASVAQAIADQEQLIADIEAAPDQAPVVLEASTRAAELVEGGGEGVDADGDGLSDTAETELVQIVEDTRAALIPEGLLVETLDPESPESVEGTPDAETADAMVASLEQLAESVPALRLLAEDAAAALEGAGEGEDLDGDGLSDESEQQISSLLSQAQQLLEPTELPAIQLDPQNPQTDGSQPDIVVARQAASALQSLATSLGVSASNQERLVEQAQQGLDFLLNADEEKAWEVDIDAVAEATFEGDVDQASRAVGLFNAYCARCHTSDWSAGVPYTLEVGAGGLGPALWNNRPNVQFIAEEDMIDFLINGSEANVGYGVNGMGTGRMPGFGQVLQLEDIELITRYLRGPTLTGR